MTNSRNWIVKENTAPVIGSPEVSTIEDIRYGRICGVGKSREETACTQVHSAICFR